MDKHYNIIILGASYGSLLGIKMAMAGHRVDLVCLPDEVKAINESGAIVRYVICFFWKSSGKAPLRGLTPVYAHTESNSIERISTCKTLSLIHI